MTTVQKYPIQTPGDQKILMPSGAKIRHVGPDPHGLPCVWAEHNPINTPRPVRLIIVATGAPLPRGAKHHFATWVQGSFVYHAYLG